MTSLKRKEIELAYSQDLKSPNILVDSNWRVKITDFGLSQMRFRTLVSHAGVGAGSPHWMAPEMLRCENLDEKADVYSYGVVLWELLTGRLPWEDLNPMQVVGAVGFRGRSLSVPETGDPVLLELFKACCQQQPINRPSFSHILETLNSCYGRASLGHQSHRALPACDLNSSKDCVGSGKVLDVLNKAGGDKQSTSKDHTPIQQPCPQTMEVLSGDSEKVTPDAKMDQIVEPVGKGMQNAGMENGPCLLNAQNEYSAGVKKPFVALSPFALQSSEPFGNSCEDHLKSNENGGSTEMSSDQPGEISQLSIVSPIENIPVESRGRNVGEHESVGYMSADHNNEQASKSPFATYAMVPFEHDKEESFDVLKRSKNDSTMAALFPPSGCISKSTGFGGYHAISETDFPLETKEAPLLPCTSSTVTMLPNLRSDGPPISPFAPYASVPIGSDGSHSAESSSQLSSNDGAASCEWKIKVAEIDTTGPGPDYTVDDTLDGVREQFLDSPEPTWEPHCSPGYLSECPVERNVAGPSTRCSDSSSTILTATNFGLGESHAVTPSRRECTIPPVTFTQEPSKAILSGVFSGKSKPARQPKRHESLISRFRCMAGHVWRDSSTAADDCRLDGDSENESDQLYTSNTSSFSK